MLRRSLAAAKLRRFEYSEAQHVLSASGKAYLVNVRVGDMLICEYPAVDELLEFLDVRTCAYQGICS